MAGHILLNPFFNEAPPTQTGSLGWVAHTPDPSNYHSGAALGMSSPSSDGVAVNAPRFSAGGGAVMLSRATENGVPRALNGQTDYRKIPVVVDPDEDGFSSHVMNQCNLTGEAMQQALANLKARLQSQGIEITDDEVGRRRLLSMFVAGLADETAGPTRKPLILPDDVKTAQAPPAAPAPAPQAGVVGAFRSNANRAQASAAAPSRQIIQQFSGENFGAAPSPAPAAPRSHAAEPEEQVEFEIDGSGHHESYYHRVVLSLKTETTGFLILAFQRSYKGYRYFPPASDDNIGVYVASHRCSYLCRSVGMDFQDGDTHYCVLMVFDVRRDQDDQTR